MRLIDADDLNFDRLTDSICQAQAEDVVDEAPTIEPKVSGKMIDADAFAEAIENLDWYSLHNGKMIQGAEGSDNAYYKASDIYTEINKAVTIRVDLIEPKCAEGCLYGFGSDECEGCLFTTVKPKRGRWIKDRHYERCSKCGEPTNEYHNYCPNCGARMEASDD